MLDMTGRRKQPQLTSDMDEELRKIIAGELGADTPPPPEMKVNFTEAGRKPAEPQPLETITPAPAEPALPPAEKVVNVPSQPDDMDMAYARTQDRMARASDAMDRGGRQLVAGLTRTPVQDTQKASADAVATLLARRKDNASVHNQNETQRLGAAKFNFDQQEAARKAAGDRGLKDREFEYRGKHDADLAAASASTLDESRRHNLETEKSGRISALKPAGGGAGHDIAERRQGLRENAIKPRPGWEPVDDAAPTFRDADQAKKFDDATAAFGALQNHRAHAGEALRKLRAAKTPAEADTALAEVNQQMANIASKLRVAEGLNSSDASNHAVDTMLSLHDGSIANLRNFANEGRLDSILDSAIGSAGTNLDTMASSNNLRRSKSKADGGATAPDDGKITISNGKETLRIPAARLADAERDGFKRVK